MNNPINLTDPNGMWVEGAGFINNLLKSDERNKAEMKADEMDGDAFKIDGGWRASWSGDDGDGESNLNSSNFVSYYKDKKGSGSTQKAGNSIWGSLSRDLFDMPNSEHKGDPIEFFDLMKTAGKNMWDQLGAWIMKKMFETDPIITPGVPSTTSTSSNGNNNTIANVPEVPKPADSSWTEIDGPYYYNGDTTGHQVIHRSTNSSNGAADSIIWVPHKK